MAGFVTTCPTCDGRRVVEPKPTPARVDGEATCDVYIYDPCPTCSARGWIVTRWSVGLPATV